MKIHYNDDSSVAARGNMTNSNTDFLFFMLLVTTDSDLFLTLLNHRSFRMHKLSQFHSLMKWRIPTSQSSQSSCVF